MREDRASTTPADAAWFERRRSGGYPADDLPSAAELAADAEIDRIVEKRRAREDAALAAAGRHVPTTRDRIAVSLSSIAFCLADRGDVEVVCVREDVFRFDHRRPLTVEQVAGILPAWEVVERDGIVWGRVGADLYRDPLFDRSLPDQPPF